MLTLKCAMSSISLDDMPALPPSSPVSVLHNSPFYSPVRDPASPGQQPPSTFSTFHPQLRTSPEGSSCGDTDGDLEHSKGHKSDVRLLEILYFLKATMLMNQAIICQ